MRITDSVPLPRPTSPLPLAFLRTGRHGTVTEVGGLAGDLLRHDAADIIGSPFGTWGATRWPVSVVADMATKLADGGPFAAYLPLDGRHGETWTFALMLPLAGGVLAIHAEPASPAAEDEAKAWYQAIVEAESAARSEGGDDGAILAAGTSAAESFWTQSIWARYEEFLAAAMIDQARAVAYAEPEVPETTVVEDPMVDLWAVIVGLEANLGSRLGDADGASGLAERLRETSWGAMEVMGTLGRISSAAVIGSSDVSASAPALLTTAKAVAAFGGQATERLDALSKDVRATRSTVAGLGIHLAAAVLLAHVVGAAAATAWPPNDPGPGAVPAASAAEMARLLVGLLDGLIGEFGATRDALGQTADLAATTADDVAAFHQMAGSWRLQLPRWNVADHVGTHLGAMDGRARLAAEHVDHLRDLASTCRRAMGRCAAAGLFEAMNEIDALALAARGPRGRHADEAGGAA
ncbi:MAG: hypothetical protein LBK72_03510 [Bifidobacteriaceae bacterium]|nr:hypothetical protein [Bifidobacteriaceae bacterium]